MLKLTSLFLIVVIFMTGTIPAQTVSKSPELRENRSDLKQVFSKETEKLKNESTVVDAKMMDKTRRQVPKQGWTKTEKTIMVVFVVGLAALLFVVIKYGKNCIRYENNCSPADEGCYCAEYEHKDK